MTDQPQTPADDERLFQQAFAYLANELNDDEASSFESRLETDESAQQALVSAMSLAQSIDAAFATTPARSSLSPGSSATDYGLPSSRTWKQAVAPLAVFALAATLLGVALFFVVIGTQRQPVADSKSTNSITDEFRNQTGVSRAVAHAWFATVDEWEWDDATTTYPGDDPWIISMAETGEAIIDRGAGNGPLSADERHWMVVAAELDIPDDSPE